MSRLSSDPTVPATVAEAFDLDPDSFEYVSAGHINRTWTARTRGGDAVVLQRLNPIFPPGIHENIDVVTRHLTRKGLSSPRLVPAQSGALWVEHGGDVWRLQTLIEGVSHERLADDEQAREAGRVLGQFHAALADLEHEFHGSRFGAHDTRVYLAELEATLTAHRGHRAAAPVNELAREICALAESLSYPHDPPARIVHGDPKITNVLFDSSGHVALCLIDLDTLARMPVALELGDAFRSWCNAAAEDAADSRFVIDRYRAALEGYAEGAGAFLSRDEMDAIPGTTLRIAVELAARFCADALTESYFGWDRARFADASAHNRARARAQIELARSIAAQADAMTEIARETLGAP